MIAAAGTGVAAIDQEAIGAEAGFGGVFIQTKVMSTASRQFCAGWMLISITPGSGVTLITSTRGSNGGE